MQDRQSENMFMLSFLKNEFANLDTNGYDPLMSSKSILLAP